MLLPKVMILAIIQARMNSNRLPRKVLLDLLGKPVIEHIIDRVKASRLIEKVVVATTDSPADDALVSFLKQKVGCSVFRGSEDDVLDRFYCCAKEHQADVIVRITADDPLKDPEIIDQAISLLITNPQLDYCSNTMKPTFPEGLDVEVFRFNALERAYREAKLQSEHEHVTPFIWKNPDLFKSRNFEHTVDLSNWRWTLDKPEDFEFIEAIYKQFYKGSSCFPYRDVIDYIQANPKLLSINSGTVRNEGYFKSLRQEKA